MESVKPSVPVLGLGRQQPLAALSDTTRVELKRLEILTLSERTAHGHSREAINLARA